MKILPLVAGILILGSLVGCATASRVRVGTAVRQVPSTPGMTEYARPSPSWPLRLGVLAPGLAPTVGNDVSWDLPHQELQAPKVVLTLQPAPTTALPLPEIRPLPAKSTPQSRSWTWVTQNKVVALPAPSAVAVAVAVPKAVVETKTTIPAAAQPPLPVKPTAPPTAASTASLLPVETASTADFRWEDVNAVSGDLVTLHFEKANWIYLDPPAQQKTLGFQSINREKTATTFLFKPLVPGEYTLEFQRQDLTNQSIDARKVKLTVVKVGTRTTSSGTSVAPQTSLTAANNALEASRVLSASGKTAEAVQKLLQGYKADDSRINLELARLLNQTGQSDEALSYLDKNLTITGPDFQGTLELGTKLATSRDPQKKLPAYVKLWTSGSAPPPEDLFIQVLETLRTQKMTALVKDWVPRYAGWYSAPRLRDRYLYQVGQWLEEPGESRDVRAAWRAYNEVVQSFPLSPHWKAAGERAAYINRHFLQVR